MDGRKRVDTVWQKSKKAADRHGNDAGGTCGAGGDYH